MGTREYTRPLQAPPVGRCPGISSEGRQHIPPVPFREPRLHLMTPQTIPQTTLPAPPYARQGHQTDLSLRVKLFPAGEHPPATIHHQQTETRGAIQLILDIPILPLFPSLSPHPTRREAHTHKGKVLSDTSEVARMPSGRKQLAAINPRHCLS